MFSRSRFLITSLRFFSSISSFSLASSRNCSVVELMNPSVASKSCCWREANANHNDYHSGSFSSIATILITHLLNVSDGSKYFSSSSTTPKSNTSSNTSQQQQTVSSSSSSNNKSDTTLFLGRELGSLIQHHIIKTIASQEYEVKKMSGNALMMRRLMSAAISSSTKNNDKRGGGK